MMRAQLEDIRERGEPIAALWASEEVIYRRFGYGLASLSGEMALPSGYTALREPPDDRATVRLVPLEESKDVFAAIYDRVRAAHARACSPAPTPGGRRATSRIRRTGARAAARRTRSCSSSTASPPATRSTAST